MNYMRNSQPRPQPPQPNKHLVAGALAQHMAKVLGAENPEAKRMVFKEVMDFSAQHTQAGREMQVQDLSALQATLKSKLQASQSQRTSLHPRSSLHPGSLPGVSDQYVAEFKHKLREEEVARHRKCDNKGRGRLRDILQARLNDPWAVLMKSDSEQFAQQEQQRKEQSRQSKQRFKDTLDAQCQERLQHKQETRARVRAEWDQEARDLAAWKESQASMENKRQAGVKSLMAAQQGQLAEMAERRGKEAVLRAREQERFRARVAAEQEKARLAEAARRELNFKLMQGYMEESKASEAVKAQSKKVEAEMEAKAKREMAAQLDRSEAEYKQAKEARMRRQDAASKHAVGKTWERRYLPDELQAKYAERLDHKLNHDEAVVWARKHSQRTELLRGLDSQMDEMEGRRHVQQMEKEVWNQRLKTMASDASQDRSNKDLKSKNENKKWKQVLDDQLQEFRYDQAFAQYSMSRTDRVLNTPHLGVLSMGS
mmetsp:Transcript_3411/g.6747  ORF Transcript_3411/g.6747 Transcript_3411/m.6747 type:complete len:484 (-) Transcript_3411:332-1783(-)|eukprot:CAMPEP_0114246290 /NCGR_PEP_ID=MMETSP0058-20121206/12376_1 /TAXON_ID=36894 /ORGANISM="Pyramimonas parkeae, CCMP726" /LENGTH=483 /DNA_ID=CAMNT_0001359451 /DNA_START=191 /DNA_END=1642 /DNA_ORIENTATION=+